MTTSSTASSRPLSVARTFSFRSTEEMVAVLGPHDGNITLIEQTFPGLTIRPKGLDVVVTGPSETVATTVRLLAELTILVENDTQVTGDVVKRIMGMMTASLSHPATAISQNILSSRGKNIRPKTINQKSYVDAIDANTVVFGIGPAGTGKTYLAMAKAVQALQSKEVNRIILTRPAVEAGERLGFLPGSLNEKIDPYLRPLYDALHDMMDPETIPRLMEAGTIEVAPLAYMRGRTLNDAFIILDEAQNTTVEQMKMFLTRLGFGSKMVITGDVTQVDLPGGQASGLKQIRQILEGIDDIHFAVLQAEDVVRHSLVSDIVSAYDKWDDAKTSMERRRNRKVKRQTIEAAAEKLLQQSGIDVTPEEKA
ncbi:PhoH family protein [Rothia nasimurium]|uniref:PhoH family protein n=1 Tax=Rothia nasimurium TaxID=85336 RepID=UPI001F33A555|nr:PhoH family protein [Rothia nasimurium]